MKKIIIVTFLAFVLLLSSVAAASAHGTVDQQNVPGPPWTTYVPLTGAVVGQSFVPQWKDITGVDLYIQYAVLPSATPANLKIRIRQGPPGCPSWLCVVSTQTVSVPPAFVGWIHVDLPTTLVVNGGDTYGIQASSTNAAMRWFYGGNTYVPGSAYYATSPPWLLGFQPLYDFSFATYH